MGRWERAFEQTGPTSTSSTFQTSSRTPSSWIDLRPGKVAHLAFLAVFALLANDTKSDDAGQSEGREEALVAAISPEALIVPWNATPIPSREHAPARVTHLRPFARLPKYTASFAFAVVYPAVAGLAVQLVIVLVGCIAALADQAVAAFTYRPAAYDYDGATPSE